MSILGLDTLVAVAGLEASLYPLGQFADQTTELVRRYPHLEPELAVAQAHCLEATRAVSRAVEFLRIRFEVAS